MNVWVVSVAQMDLLLINTLIIIIGLVLVAYSVTRLIQY